MSTKRIQFADKINFNEKDVHNEELWAEDINEIKTVVNANEKGQVNHSKNKDNPHSLNADSIGLGNVNNTSDLKKPISQAQAAALATKPTLIDGKVLLKQLEIPKASDISYTPDKTVEEVINDLFKLKSNSENSLKVVENISSIVSTGIYLVTKDKTVTNLVEIDVSDLLKESLRKISINDLEDLLIVEYTIRKDSIEGYLARIHRLNGEFLGRHRKHIDSSDYYIELNRQYIKTNVKLDNYYYENSEEYCLKRTIQKKELNFIEDFILLDDRLKAYRYLEGELSLFGDGVMHNTKSIKVGYANVLTPNRPYVLSDNEGQLFENNLFNAISYVLKYSKDTVTSGDQDISKNVIDGVNVLNADNIGSTHAQAMEYWFTSYYEGWSALKWTSQFVTKKLTAARSRPNQECYDSNANVLMIPTAITLNKAEFLRQGNTQLVVHAHGSNSSELINLEGFIKGEVLPNTIIVRGGVLGENEKTATSSYGIGVTFVMPSSPSYLVANIPFYNRSEALANNAGTHDDPNSKEHDQSPASAYVSAIVKAIMNLTGIQNPEIIVKAMIVTADRSGANTSLDVGAFGQPWNPFDGYGIPRALEAVEYINSTLRPELVNQSKNALYKTNRVPDYFDYDSIPDDVAPAKWMLKKRSLSLPEINVPLILSTGVMRVRVDNGLVTILIYNLKLNSPTPRGSSLYSISEKIPLEYSVWAFHPSFVLATNEGFAFHAQIVESRLTIRLSRSKRIEELSEYEFSGSVTIPLK